jgi:hypothetical protein
LRCHRGQNSKRSKPREKQPFHHYLYHRLLLPKVNMLGMSAAHELEMEWNPESDDPSLTLDIYLEKKNGHHQLFAIFHLRIITGVMRFEKPIPVSKSQKASESSSKRKWDEIDDDGDVNMADYPSYSSNAQGSSKYDVKEFYLGAADSPTARRPTWRYRWRGEETGEGEIQLDSDEVVQAITF